MEEFSDCDDIQLASKYKHNRTIIHIDLDCFYAQVEMLKNPELSTKPVGIKQQHYVITSNYIAREYGIKKCMLITDALALCPKLVIVNGEDLHDYRVMSSKVTDVIRGFTNSVEKLGLDENFVDVSDLIPSKLDVAKNNKEIEIVGHVYHNETECICSCGCKERLTIGSRIANEMRLKIKEELGMTCCAGIGHNKLLAKLVCPTHKPDQQTTVFPCAALSLVLNLKSVRSIPGVGRKTSDILDHLGISSVYDVQNSSIDLLEKHCGKALASWIKAACFSVDDTVVKESQKQQVIGLEEASKMIGSMQDVHKRLHSLIERGMLLLEEDGRYPTTIRVSVRKYNHKEYLRQRESKQCAINPVLFKSSAPEEKIFEIALTLFKTLVDHTKPFHLTLIGLAFTKFQEELPNERSLLKYFTKKSEKDSIKVLSVTDNDSDNRCYSKPNDIKTTEMFSNETLHKTNTLSNIDESVLSELPEDIRTEILQTYPQVNKPSTSTSQLRASSDVQCPLGMDPTVFNELPHEIQMELVRDSGKTNTNRAKNSIAVSKKQNTILNYLKK